MISILLQLAIRGSTALMLLAATLGTAPAAGQGFAGGYRLVGAPTPAPLATAEEAAVDSAREALSDGEFPWYDSQTDSLQPMDLTVDRSSSSSGFEWPDWNLGTVFQVLIYTVLGLILAGLLAAIIYFIRNQERAPKAPQVADDQILAPDQVEALPFLAERPRDDLLAQARRHYEAGNYSEAIIYLFSYELLALDKFSLIHLTKGKTNRQYLREMSRDAALRSPLERTLVAFESVFFGNRPLDRASFEACWQELPQFEQLRAPA